MKKQIVILVSMLFIASVLPAISLPATSTTDENDIDHPYFEFFVERSCIECNEFNDESEQNPGESSRSERSCK